MNKTITPYALLLAFGLLIGCQHPEESNIKTIRADIENLQEVSIFDIFSHIEIIPLETTDNSLIRDICNVVSFRDKYFILDRWQTKVLIFRRDGTFLNKISDRGQGAKEYLYISYFEVDTFRNILTLLDPISQSMFEYDLYGNFLNRFRLPNIPRVYTAYRQLNKDTIVFWTLDESNRVKFYSRSENAIFQEAYPEDRETLRERTRVVFWGNYLPRGNTVYRITEDAQVVENHQWDFGHLNNTRKQIRRVEYINWRAYWPKLKNSELVNHVQMAHGGNSQFYYTRLLRRGKFIHVFHNRATKENLVFNKTTEGIQFIPIAWYEDYVIGLHFEEWGTLDEFVPDAILDERNREIKRGIDEFDNPILIKYHFRR